MRQPAVILVALVAMLGGCAGARGTGASAQPAALEHVLDEWATAWSSSDVDELLPLFTDDVRYEDVTFGVVTQGKVGLRDFAIAAFGAFPGMSFEIESRFVGDKP